MRFFYYLIITVLIVGCSKPAPTPTPTSTPTTTHGFQFDRPSDWTDDAKTMEGRADLYAVQSADGEGKAFGMPFDFDFESSEPTKELGDDLTPRLASFILAFEKSMPKRYEGWKLVRHGGVKFQDQNIGEIVFTGRDTTKTDEGQRWRRILVMPRPDDENRLVLLGFSAPIGQEKNFQEAFQAIEKSWRWD
jgi:hypothetical protein